MSETFWRILALEPTSDAKLIRRAYAQQLKLRPPEGDLGAFQQLVQARDAALNHAKRQAKAPKPESGRPEPVKPEGEAEKPTKLRARLARTGKASLTELSGDAPPEKRGEHADDYWAELDRLTKPQMLFLPARWQALLDAAAACDLQAGRRLCEAVTKRFLAGLPSYRIAATSDAFRDICDTLVLLSTRYGWGQDQTQLLQLVDSATVAKLNDWDVGLVERARQQKREQEILAGKRPLRHPNGVPIIDADDRKMLFADPKLAAFYDASVRMGPLKVPPFGSRIQWLIPVMGVVEAGYKRVAWGIIGVGICLVLLATLKPYDVTAALLTMVAAFSTLLFHITMPLIVTQLKLARAAQAVRKADRLRIADPGERSRFLIERAPLGPSDHLLPAIWMGIAHMVMSVIILFAAVSTALPTWQDQMILDKPAEALYAALVVDAVETERQNQGHTSAKFVPFLKRLTAERRQFLSATGPDIGRLWRQQHAALQHLQSQFSATAGGGATSKNLTITHFSQRYLAASPDDRRAMEDLLLAQLDVLQPADLPKASDTDVLWRWIDPSLSDKDRTLLVPQVADLLRYSLWRSLFSTSDFAKGESAKNHAIAVHVVFTLPDRVLADQYLTSAPSLAAWGFDPLKLKASLPAYWRDSAAAMEQTLQNPNFIFTSPNRNQLFRVFGQCMHVSTAETRKEIEKIIVSALDNEPVTDSFDFWLAVNRKLLEQKSCLLVMLSP